MAILGFDCSCGYRRCRRNLPAGPVIGVALSLWLLPALHAALAITVAAHALLHKRDPRSAWAWILACLLIPFGGALLYWWFGINRTARRAVREVGAPQTVAADTSADIALEIEGTDAREIAELVRIGRAMTGRALLGGNRITVLHNGEQAYPAMLEAIAGARDRVWLMSYIFDPDATGEQFADALHGAMRRGVQVRVLLDGVGDLRLGTRGSTLLHRRGLRVARFIPPRLFPPLLHINVRNHRKLLCVDGEQAFLGGMNIGDHQNLSMSLLSRGTRLAAEDIHFRVQGPVAAQLDRVFVEDWRAADGETLTCEAPAPIPLGNARCRVITDGPNDDLGRLQMMLLGALSNAHRSVQIMTPYFVPTAELSGALTAAAWRGVEVSLLLPERSNYPWLDAATRRWLAQVGDSPIRIHRRPPPFAHSKLFLIDDYYALVGSANLDSRSLRLNFELMLEIYDVALLAELGAHVRATRDASPLLDVHKLRSRPLPARLFDAACWLFSPYL